MRRYRIIPLLVIAIGVALIAGRHRHGYLKERDWDAW